MKLNHIRVGQGPALIIVHGLFGEGENWRTIAERIGTVATVFAIDLRNHGQSPHTERISLEEMADDIREFMDDLGLATASILGHSLGGKVAMQFAVRHPSRVDKLIVVDVGPSATGGVFSGEILESLYRMSPEGMKTRREIDEALASSVEDRRSRLFLMKDLRRVEDGTFRWKIGIRELHGNKQELRRPVAFEGICRIPTLFVIGGASDYVTEGDVFEIGKRFSDARIERIDNAGHWVHVDAPDQFVRSVISFLTTL